MRLPLILLLLTLPAMAEPIIGDPILGADDPLLGSKHDFTGLNDRAGVVAMSGVAFADYGYACVYCHIPPEAEGDTVEGSIPEWNRFSSNPENFKLFYSSTLDERSKGINSISMLCLSCHDGTQAVDMVASKPPNYSIQSDKSLHMALGIQDDIEHCGKCHNGYIAHDITIKVLGTDLRNDHPISMRYAGLGFKDSDFRYPTNDDPLTGFKNGVKLYNGQVECMTCHNVHDPSKELLLRENAEYLCFTCHMK